MPIFCDNETEINIDESDIIAIAQFCLVTLEISLDVELSINFISDDYIAELHEQWLDLPGATDVMSFPVDEIKPGFQFDSCTLIEPPVLGDIVIAPAFASRQALAAGRTLEEELHILVVHGILHLSGYDHYEPDEREIMFDLQENIVRDYIFSLTNIPINFESRDTTIVHQDKYN